MITVSGLQKQTSATSELFFQYRFRPYSRNRHASVKFHPNGTILRGVMTLSRFSRRRPLRRNFTFRYDLVMWLAFEGQCLPANQISSAYINAQLMYDHLRHGNINVRHIAIVFSVAISTIAVISMPFCIRLPQCIQIGVSETELWCHIDFQVDGRHSAILLPVSDVVKSLMCNPHRSS